LAFNGISQIVVRQFGMWSGTLRADTNRHRVNEAARRTQFCPAKETDSLVFGWRSLQTNGAVSSGNGRIVPGVSELDFFGLLAAVTEAGEPDEALERICTYLEGALPGCRVSVLALDGWVLTCAAAPSLPSEYIRAITGALLHPGSGLNGATTDGLPCILGDLGLVEHSSTPILSSQGALLGLLDLYTNEPTDLDAEPSRGIASRLAAVVLERRSMERRMIFETNHDPTTGLPNRRRFLDLLDGELSAAAREHEQVTVAALDMDRFRQVNEAMGHDGGDRLLRYAGERLRSVVGGNGIVARTGSDEFAIASRGPATALEELLRSALAGPFTVFGRELFVTCAAGLAVSDDEAPDGSSLLRQAESAVQRARAIGPNAVSRFRSSRRHSSASDFDIEEKLRRAFAGSELEVRYQPVHRAAGELAGFEALLACGSIAPRDFIRVAEVSGIIVPIGAWVLDNACGRAARWSTRGRGGIRLSVNVSAVQFASPGFVNVVYDALEHSGLPPNLLELEITESVLMRDVERSIRRMSELRRTGVRLAIDDFGTGYSSLNYLRLLPATTVKIDQSFVRDLPQSSGTLTVIRSVIALAHGLGLEVVAEGVETERQLELLREAGCDCFQGHLLGRPVDASEVERAYLRPAATSSSICTRSVG
jgi:diguanylate cyclase (GGDEF)-like protein